MITVNATNFRKSMFNHIDSVIKYNEPLNISTKNGNVVVLSEDEYRGILETLYIETVPNLKEEILAGSKEEGIEIDWRKQLS